MPDQPQTSQPAPVDLKIIKELETALATFNAARRKVSLGTVLSVGDGIAQVIGLSGVGALELVEFSSARVAWP